MASALPERRTVAEVAGQVTAGFGRTVSAGNIVPATTGPATTGPTTTAPATWATARPAAGPAHPPTVVLKPVRAAGFDVLESPEQDPSNEESATAPLAIDGNPATAWHTQYYGANPVFGGLKQGSGLILDMGRAVRIRSVTVTFGPAPGADVSIEVGSHDTLAAATLATFRTVARADDVGGTRMFRATRSARGRYVLICSPSCPRWGTASSRARSSTSSSGDPDGHAAGQHAVCLYADACERRWRRPVRWRRQKTG